MLVLASSSPRRRSLLSSLDVPFSIHMSNMDERPPRSGEEPEEYALELARGKAEAVASEHPLDVVLGADTVVWVDDAILGKPENADDALGMLRLLRGREHRVTTAVVVIAPGHVRGGAATARVRMRDFGDDEARAYVATGEPMDKAGAYAVQEFGGQFVESVEGCYNAVVGLPLCLTVRLLREVGEDVRLPPAATCKRACEGTDRMPEGSDRETEVLP